MVAGAWLLAGCVGTKPSAASDAPIRRIYVADAVGTASADFRGLNDVVHDTAVRALQEKGYVAVAEPAAAEAILSASWHRRPSEAGSLAGRVGLRLVLESRDGSKLFMAEPIDGIQAAFLTSARVADSVRSGLSQVPPAPLVR